MAEQTAKKRFFVIADGRAVEGSRQIRREFSGSVKRGSKDIPMTGGSPFLLREQTKKGEIKRSSLAF